MTDAIHNKLDLKLILLGFSVALFSAGIGIGGGTLLVSMLMAMFGFDFKKAASTSLAAIIPISLVGSLSHFLLLPGVSDPMYYFTFIPLCVTGSILGGRIIPKRRNTWLKLAFSLFLFIASLRMLKFVDCPALVYGNLHDFMFTYQVPVIVLMGIATGMVSVLLGIGCGLMIVPFFVIIIDLDMHQAITLSLTTMFFLTISGTIIHRKLKTLNRIPIKNLILPALCGAMFGVIISSHLPAFLLRKIFGVFLFVIACKFIAFESFTLYKESGVFKTPLKGGQQI